MKKVMVVDDASTVRMYHKALLEEIGIFILEASNGVEALETSARNARGPISGGYQYAQDGWLYSR